MSADRAEEAAAPEPGRWLNRNVVGMGLTSFLADAGYETVSAVLPGFLATLGAPAFALGVIEGVADAVSSFVKLAAGWWSDRLGHRKGIGVLGYALSGGASFFFAVASCWPVVLLGRTVAWFGRGIRGPARDAILVASVSLADRGKAFGFHRAGDTLGAIVGPLLGPLLLAVLPPPASGDTTAAFRLIFLLTLIPGLGSALSFAVLVRERRRAAPPARKLWVSVRALPAPFRRFLLAVGVFGIGDFAPTLLILAATRLLEPAHGLAGAAQVGALLYALRNAAQAGASYPIGALSDRLGRGGLLALGFGLGGVVMLSFAALFAGGVASVPLLAVLFALAGVVIAFSEALEGALAADLVPDETLRGTAFGALGAVNGVGDLVSSTVVGLLMGVNPVYGFVYAALMMLAGALLLLSRAR